MQGPEAQKRLFLILTVSNSDAVAGNTSAEVTVCKGRKRSAYFVSNVV